MRKLIFIVALAFLVVVGFSIAEQPALKLRTANPQASIDAQLHPDARISNMLHNSCYNCHSEQGEVPFYAHVWPGSKLLQSDIRDGRARLDFSEWNRLSPEMSRVRLLEACDMIRGGKMPLWYYKPMHPGSGVSEADADYFCQWANSQPVPSPDAVNRPDGLTAQTQ
jgi:hypothetical protein